MSATNVERIQAIYAAFGRGDLAAALDIYAEQAIVHQAAALPYGGTHQGRAAIEQSIAIIISTWDDLRIEVAEYLDAGNKVIVRERFFGRPRHAMALIEMPMIEVFTLNAGQVTDVEVFYHDTAQLLAALSGSI